MRLRYSERLTDFFQKLDILETKGKRQKRGTGKTGDATKKLPRTTYFQQKDKKSH